MNKNSDFFSEDISFFYKYLTGVRKIKQDTVFHISKKKSNKNVSLRKEIEEQESHSYFFNKNSSNHYFLNNPISYVRTVLFKSELNKLKSGGYIPDICIDLHGLNQYEAKKELGKIIYLCCKENFFCFLIIHGHGKNILKYTIPIWLSKHPDILAFHQASKNFGSSAALLVLIQKNR
ncbi:endonuclease SmrB [Buchnera aphidicola]|uniref:endonuclease SmrB n=1 Tax=Buchnera aphidicola TaxID=9 RepID=UPI003463D9CF